MQLIRIKHTWSSTMNMLPEILQYINAVTITQFMELWHDTQNHFILTLILNMISKLQLKQINQTGFVMLLEMSPILRMSLSHMWP